MQMLQKTDAAKKKKGAFQQVGTVGRKALPHLPHCSFTLRMFFLHYLTLVLCFPLVPVVPVLSCGGVHSCDTKADVGPRVQVTRVPKKDAFKGRSPILPLLNLPAQLRAYRRKLISFRIYQTRTLTKP